MQSFHFIMLCQNQTAELETCVLAFHHGHSPCSTCDLAIFLALDISSIAGRSGRCLDDGSTKQLTPPTSALRVLAGIANDRIDIADADSATTTTRTTLQFGQFPTRRYSLRYCGWIA